jgi:hypothetical protein
MVNSVAFKRTGGGVLFSVARGAAAEHPRHEQRRLKAKFE